jgi:hypothetical protein
VRTLTSGRLAWPRSAAKRCRVFESRPADQTKTSEYQHDRSPSLECVADSSRTLAGGASFSRTPSSGDRGTNRLVTGAYGAFPDAVVCLLNSTRVFPRKKKIDGELHLCILSIHSYGRLLRHLTIQQAADVSANYGSDEAAVRSGLLERMTGHSIDSTTRGGYTS